MFENIRVIKNRLSAIEPCVEGKTVLDIGCVDSRPGGVRKYMSTGLHIFLKEHAKELLGVDMDEEGAKAMREDGFDVIAADAEKMDLGRKFDCIVAGEVIEHLSNPGRFLDNMKKHLDLGGTLIITTSNAFGIGSFYRILRKNRIKVHSEHTCWYDPATLTHLLLRHSFDVEEIFFSNKSKWYLGKNFYKMKYQIPRLISALRPYFSGRIIVVARNGGSLLSQRGAEGIDE